MDYHLKSTFSLAILIILGFTASLVLYICLHDISLPISKLEIQFNISKDMDDNQVLKGYTIYTPGCKIQDFDPFDKSIVKLLDAPYRFNCSLRPTLVLVKRPNQLIVDFKVLNHYGDHLDYCLYIPIFRDGEGQSDDKFRFGRNERFYHTINVRHEFVKVECYSFYKMIFQDFYTFIIKKPYVEERCERIEKENLFRNQGLERLSILIIGIDSVSRLSFRRHCPKTRNYLLNKMKAIELNGYNKVGDNTFHNLVPMLLGTYVRELKWSANQPFDKFKFIWKDYAQNGYRTMFAEDDPKIALFNYYKRGFYHIPSDYYLRPFYVAYNHSVKSIGSRFECLERKLHSQVILDYAYDFLKTFSKDLYFAFFFMSSLTHGYSRTVELGEKYYQEFLIKVNEENLLNNTILYFLSDHGIRFGRFRYSYVGRMEERLPMAYIYFPQWFHKKYPKIVKSVRKNSQKLTTPFDIYATLKDLLNFTGVKTNKISSTQRGISLFDDIPENRRCEDATILPHWCTCQEKTQLSKDDPIVKRAASFIVKEINQLIESSSDICAELYVKSISTAWYSSVNTKILKYSHLLGMGDSEEVRFKNKKILSIQDITVTLITSPSDAYFEATVRYIEHYNRFNLAGDISRINKYGEESFCVDDYIKKKYCYCTVLLNDN